MSCPRCHETKTIPLDSTRAVCARCSTIYTPVPSVEPGPRTRPQKKRRHETPPWPQGADLDDDFEGVPV